MSFVGARGVRTLLIHLAANRAKRLEYAWQLVYCSELSKAEIMEETGVSESTVANMRKIHKRLLKAISLEDFFDLPWGVAKTLSREVIPALVKTR